MFLLLNKAQILKVHFPISFDFLVLFIMAIVHKLSVNVLIHELCFLSKMYVFWDKLNSVQNVRGWGCFGYVFISLSYY